MKLRFITCTCVCLTVATMSGCSSFKSLASKDTSTIDDPLSDPGESSESYIAAKRELKSKAPATVLAFAEWKEDIGNFDEAKAKYNDVLSDDPHNVDARIGIARVEFKTGRKQEAQRILTATVKKYPESKAAWLELGRLHARQDQWESAISGLGRAVKLDPTDRVVNYELGVAMTRNNQLEEGHRYLAVAGGDSSASYNVGYLLHEQGRSADAAVWMQRALDSKPDPKTRSSAEKLLAVLGQGQQRNTMLASQSRTVPQQAQINKDKTTYQNYKERPNSDGFPAANRPAAGVVSMGPAPVISPGVQSTAAPRQPIRTANMQRTLPQDSFQNQNTVRDWRGPSNNQMQMQPLVTPASATQSQMASPPQWQRSR